MKNWKDLIVSEQVTIKEVMALFERKNAQIALVASQDNVLLGVVTDGDMRRSILKNIKLTDSIKGTMNCSPFSVTPDKPLQEIIKKFDDFDIKYIPIVDEKNVIKGLYNRSDFIQAKKNDTPVVIMAGGEGLRLRPLTKTLPKPLVTINGTPILEKLLVNLIGQGFSSFFLSINYLGGMIEDYFGDGKKWGVEIQYLREQKKLGTGGSLNFLKNINRDLIILNGDLVTNINFKMILEHHISNDACITIGVQKVLFRIPYGVVNCDNIHVASLEEKPILHFNANCGIYVFSSQVAQRIMEEESIDMPCLINRFLSEKEKVIVFPIYEEWHDIGNIHDLEKIENKHDF